MRRRVMPIVTVIVAAMVTACSTSLEAPPPPPPPAPVPEASSAAGFYSVEQAARGREAFQRVCGECHFTREFRGRDFEYQWRRRTVWDFYRNVSRTMPDDMPGILPNETYADVIAYILQLNEYSAGDSELIVSEEVMDTIPLGPGAAKQPSQDGEEQ